MEEPRAKQVPARGDRPKIDQDTTDRNEQQPLYERERPNPSQDKKE